MNEETLFHLALEKPANERAAFLDDACAGDRALRQSVEALLQAHENPGSFLANVPADAQATVAPDPVPQAHAPVSPTEGPGTRIGPYKLLQKLGEGGMGVVYLAEQERPVKRRVALKIIKAGMDSAQVIARFEQERQALAMMDHPNIARVLDAGTTATGRPYFVMELVKGIPMTAYCDQAHLTPTERLQLFIPVCHAVQHAHQKGVIHRDLKPSNVMIALYDGKPVPKVIDFGVAKATNQKLTERTMFTEIGSIVGTLEYMAPEQAELNNLDIDTRADVYSLGVLLYELLTGSPPFTSAQLRSAGFPEMLRMICEVEPPRPSTRLSSSKELPTIAASRKLEPRKLTQQVFGDLDWIVMKALEKDRGRRYETANGLAEDIARYLADDPVLAGPPSLAYRLRKFMKRNRGPVLAASVLLLALVAGMIGTTWGLMRAMRAEADAIDARDDAILKEMEAIDEKVHAARAEEKAWDAEQNARAEAFQAKKARDEAEQERNNVTAANMELKKVTDHLRSTLYASHLNLAQDAWEQNNINRLRELLDGQRPERTGGIDLRGFEWHYWHRQGHAELSTQTLKARISGDSNSTLSLNADGSRLVMNVANESLGDFQPQVFDTATGQERFALPLLRRSFNNRTAFNREGTLLACAGRSNNGWLRIHDLTTNKELFSKENLGQIADVALSSDGKWVAATGCGKNQDRQWFIESEGKVWEVATGKEVCRIPKHWHASLPNALVFSPNGKQLAGIVALQNPTSKLYEMEVKVWDVATGQERCSLGKGNACLSGVVFSPDGSHLAARYYQGFWARAVLAFIADEEGLTAANPKGERQQALAETSIKVWEVATSKELLKGQFTLDGGLPAFGRPVFSPDGKLLAAGALNRTATLWDLTTGRVRRLLKGHANAVAAVAFSRDGSQLISVEEETGTIKAWDATHDDAPLLVKVHRLVLSPCGTRLACLADIPPESSLKEKSEVRVLDISGKELCSFDEKTEESIGLAFSPDGLRLVTLSSRSEGGPQSGTRTLKVRDARTGKVQFEKKSPGSLGKIVGNGLDQRIAFSSDGKRLVLDGGQASTTESQVFLTQLDAGTGRELLTFKVEADALPGFTFSRDAARFAGRLWWGPVKVWEAETGKELLSVASKNWQCDHALSPDGQRLATCDERNVIVHTIATGALLPLKGHSRAVTCVAFCPMGRRIASATGWRGAPPVQGNEVKIWDAVTGQELMTLKGHSGDIRNLMFTPDGHRLMAAGPSAITPGDVEIRVWNATPR